jgi:large subunit ribosomal protein L30
MNKEASHVQHSPNEGKKFAIVLVRGRFAMDGEIKHTLDMLKLHRKNYCVVFNDSPAIRGMAYKIKTFATYGNIDNDIYELMIEKRGEEYQGRLSDSKGIIKYKQKYLEHKGKKYKPFFRLSPPRKGFGRKGIKRSFVIGGALGDRKEKINDLIKRML